MSRVKSIMRLVLMGSRQSMMGRGEGRRQRVRVLLTRSTQVWALTLLLLGGHSGRRRAASPSTWLLPSSAHCTPMC